MPYSGPEDKNLPSNVQALPVDLRKQWVAVWNSTYRNCMDPSKGGGAGREKDCEGAAFRFANGVTEKQAKELEDPAVSYKEQLLQFVGVHSSSALWGEKRGYARDSMGRFASTGGGGPAATGSRAEQKAGALKKLSEPSRLGTASATVAGPRGSYTVGRINRFTKKGDVPTYRIFNDRTGKLVGATGARGSGRYFDKPESAVDHALNLAGV